MTEEGGPESIDGLGMLASVSEAEVGRSDTEGDDVRGEETLTPTLGFPASENRSEPTRFAPSEGPHGHPPRVRFHLENNHRDARSSSRPKRFTRHFSSSRRESFDDDESADTPRTPRRVRWLDERPDSPGSGHDADAESVASHGALGDTVGIDSDGIAFHSSLPSLTGRRGGIRRSRRAGSGSPSRSRSRSLPSFRPDRSDGVSTGYGSSEGVSPALELDEDRGGGGGIASRGWSPASARSGPPSVASIGVGPLPMLRVPVNPSSSSILGTSDLEGWGGGGDGREADDEGSGSPWLPPHRGDRGRAQGAGTHSTAEARGPGRGSSHRRRSSITAGGDEGGVSGLSRRPRPWAETGSPWRWDTPWEFPPRRRSRSRSSSFGLVGGARAGDDNVDEEEPIFGGIPEGLFPSGPLAPFASTGRLPRREQNQPLAVPASVARTTTHPSTSASSRQTRVHFADHLEQMPAQSAEAAVPGLIREMKRLQEESARLADRAHEIRLWRDDALKDPIAHAINLEQIAEYSVGDLPVPERYRHLRTQEKRLSHDDKGSSSKRRSPVASEAEAPPAAETKPAPKGAWSESEQLQLEKLLAEIPQQQVELERWSAIAEHFPSRSAKQVASRAKKYFTKLAQAGFQVPGRCEELLLGHTRRVADEARDRMRSTGERFREAMRAVQRERTAAAESKNASRLNAEETLPSDGRSMWWHLTERRKRRRAHSESGAPPKKRPTNSGQSR